MPPTSSPPPSSKSGPSTNLSPPPPSAHPRRSFPFPPRREIQSPPARRFRRPLPGSRRDRSIRRRLLLRHATHPGIRHPPRRRRSTRGNPPPPLQRSRSPRRRRSRDRTSRRRRPHPIHVDPAFRRQPPRPANLYMRRRVPARRGRCRLHHPRETRHPGRPHHRPALRIANCCDAPKKNGREILAAVDPSSQALRLAEKLGHLLLAQSQHSRQPQAQHQQTCRLRHRRRRSGYRGIPAQERFPGVAVLEDRPTANRKYPGRQHERPIAREQLRANETDYLRDALLVGEGYVEEAAVRVTVIKERNFGVPDRFPRRRYGQRRERVQRIQSAGLRK